MGWDGMGDGPAGIGWVSRPTTDVSGGGFGDSIAQRRRTITCGESLLQDLESYGVPSALGL